MITPDVVAGKRRSSVAADAQDAADRIITAVRVRPMSGAESVDECKVVMVPEIGEQGMCIVDPAYFSTDASISDRRAYERCFRFDHFFWSATEADVVDFATQSYVFEACAKPLVGHCIAGFNCAIFAYGQTGSGKTHTMMGVENGTEGAGVVPRLCRALFADVAELSSGNKNTGGIRRPSAIPISSTSATSIARPGAGGGIRSNIKVGGGGSNLDNLAAAAVGEIYKGLIEVTYYEIYNEKVYDLLSNSTEIACRVREHPDQGAYVESLTRIEIKNYDDVSVVLQRGHKHRAVAATILNSASSRSHAIFTVHLTQMIPAAKGSVAPTPNGRGSNSSSSSLDGMTTPKHRTNMAGVQHGTHGDLHGAATAGVTITRKSKVCLVDLAGSERASATGVTGDRLTEANNINKSLSTLGDVIQALSNMSTHAGRRESLLNSTSKNNTAAGGHHVPYRNSVLTWLLKDCIGGNSKSVMLATVSPTDIAYNESISTLRYVERAKLITTHAVINETTNDAQIISQLQKQVHQLQKQLNEKDTLLANTTAVKAPTTEPAGSSTPKNSTKEGNGVAVSSSSSHGHEEDMSRLAELVNQKQEVA